MLNYFPDAQIYSHIYISSLLLLILLLLLLLLFHICKVLHKKGRAIPTQA
jgi:hypothetical protein